MSTPDPARLAQIRARSRRLAAIALDVSPGDNCVVTDLVESASDVRWLLERMEQPQDDGDARAVRAVVDAAGKLPIPQYETMPELASALNALLERFEDRIKVIDEAESLARLRARMAADNGNRTPLDEVLAMYGLASADLERAQ